MYGGGEGEGEGYKGCGRVVLWYMIDEGRLFYRVVYWREKVVLLEGVGSLVVHWEWCGMVSVGTL